MIKYNAKKDSYQFDKDSIDSFINIAFVVTTRCNLKCVHCCDSQPSPDAPFKNLKKIVDKLAKNGLAKVCITGGEPLLRKDLTNILRYIHNKKIYITLSTNGLFLDKDRLIFIKPHIDNIRFSLHGKEKIHDKITGYKGSFRKVIEDINMARSLKIPVSIVSTVMSQNYSDMLDVARLCEENGVEKLYFFSLIAKDRGRNIFDKEHLPPEKIKMNVQEILKIAQKECWDLEIKIVNWSIEGQCVLLYQNGDLVASPSFKDEGNAKTIGNLFKSSPQALWEEYPFKNNYLDYYKNH